MISVVITAAGNSTRFGENKLLLDLAGKPLIVRTIENFGQCERIDEIVIATRASDIPLYEELFSYHHLAVKVVEGGAERIESIYNGAMASKGDIILTHDGARPLTPLWLIENLIESVLEYGAAMTALTPTATIKYAEGDLIIRRSLARDTTWIAQTPQGFTRTILLESMLDAIQEGYFVATDDSEIIARKGYNVKIVPGEPVNIKVTVKSDIVIANEIFKQKEDKHGSTQQNYSSLSITSK